MALAEKQELSEEEPESSREKLGWFDSWCKSRVEQFFAGVGIGLQGIEEWDIEVKDNRFYRTSLLFGSLGLGESYVNGWWECRSLDQLFFRLLRNCAVLRGKSAQHRLGVIEWLDVVRSYLFNPGSRARSFDVGKAHYDLGNDFFRMMLSQPMAYSCGYWARAKNLEDAQIAKFDLIARKIELKAGMSVLDIGFGWGDLAGYLADVYGVKVTGITVSEEQFQYANKFHGNRNVEFHLLDYRALDRSCYRAKFDRVVSVGMVEHVGWRNYVRFFDVVNSCLKPEGIFLLHTISGPLSARYGDAWLVRNIFPNSMVPSASQLAKSLEGRFVIEDWHNFGSDYDPTLMSWYANFEKQWVRFKDRFEDSESFFRKWKYFLLSCAGSFRARANHLYQIVLTPYGKLKGYQAPR